ncbi:MAG: tRNA (adenosine(37)-N6)-threonylcarbamoyltransferase complex dimerization subunit type 1 TsaB [Gammaproteobacteria bacterium]
MILALDATSEQCSAAILIDGQIISRSQHAPRDHTQMLLSFIDGLLKEAQTTLQQLDAIAFGAGPGSFTGIRIAAAMVQGLAFGASKPVIPISSLRAVAYECYERAGAKSVMAALDARKSEVYWGLYMWDEKAGMLLQGDETVVAPGNAHLPKGLSHWVGAGIGFHAYADALKEHTQGREAGVYPDILPEAQAIAKLAAFDFARGLAVSAEQAIPVYVRNNIL